MAKKKQSTAGSVTQLEAVRQALASGVEGAEKAVSFIKSKFGISLKPQAFYTYKSQLKSKGNATKSSTSQKIKQLTGGGIEVRNARKVRSGGEGVGVRAVKDVTEIVDRYGLKKVKEIVEVFG